MLTSGVFALACSLACFGSSLAAGGGEACSSPAGPDACLGQQSGPLITVDQAQQVAAALWKAQERANVTKNRALYDQIDTGTLLIEAQGSLDSLICGCGKFQWGRGVRTIRHLTVYVPEQHTYPLYFLADVLAAPRAATVRSGVTALFVATRASPSDPWRFASSLSDVGYGRPSQALQEPENDPSGTVEAPGATVAPSVAKKWLGMLAAYYNHLKDFGAPPANSPFLPGADTTHSGLGADEQGTKNKYGVVFHYRFVVAPGNPYVFGLYGGMACGDVLENETLTWAKSNTVFEQIDDRPGNWGPALNTGFYSKLIVTHLFSVCVTKEPGGLLVWGDGSFGDTIHTGGIPAKPGPGTTRVL